MSSYNQCVLLEEIQSLKLKVVYRVVSGDSFLAGGVLECIVSHRRSVALMHIIIRNNNSFYLNKITQYNCQNNKIQMAWLTCWLVSWQYLNKPHMAAWLIG